MTADESPPPLLYVCADGHTWTDQRDGTVSPSYGYGGTHHTWKGYDPKLCPEPERNPDTGWGYVCRFCGGLWYSGSCDCDKALRYGPPKPACLKPAIVTFVWTPHSRKREKDGLPWGWVDITARQLELLGALPPTFEQPADAIRAIEKGLLR